jgi:hypothetical protein
MLKRAVPNKSIAAEEAPMACCSKKVAYKKAMHACHVPVLWDTK